MDVVVRGFKKEPEDVSVLIGKYFNLTCQLFLGDGVSEDDTALTWFETVFRVPDQNFLIFVQCTVV